MDEKGFCFAKSQMLASTCLEKKIYIKKKMSGISLELLFLLEAEGSWRGEEGWDIYEVCREFGRKLTEGGQMVGGVGSVTLSLSLLGRPVQAQPWSRMARSHLQQAALPWETWLVRSSSSLDGGEGQSFYSWSVVETLGKCEGCTAETGLVAQTRWHCPGITSPSQERGSPRDAGAAVGRRKHPQKWGCVSTCSTSLGSQKGKSPFMSV